MPAKQQQQQQRQQAAQEQQQRQQADAALGVVVLHALGQPADLCRVQVRRLWEGHYRVNVFLGADAVSARVGHSYFLVADGDGKIVTSTPAITRQY